MSSTLGHAARDLPHDLAAAVQLIAVLPFREIEPGLLAAGLGVTLATAEEYLRALERRFFVDRSLIDRYVLVGAAADGVAESLPDPAVLIGSVRRSVVWWLASLTAAERVLTPTHRVLERESVGLGETPIVPLAFASPQEAWAWLAEQEVLVRPVLAACSGRWPSLVWQIAHALWPLFHRLRLQQLRLWALDLAIPAVQVSGSRLAIREIHNARAGALRDLGQFDQAIEAATVALAMAEEDGDLRGQGQYRHEIGATLHAAGHPSQALPHLLQALALRKQDHYTRGIALTRLMIGACHLDLGNLPLAQLQLRTAHHALLRIDDKLDAARALAFYGRVLVGLGDALAAVAALDQAASEFAQVGARAWQARATAWSADVLDGLGRTGDATAALHRALDLYGGAYPQDTARIRAALDGRPASP